MRTVRSLCLVAAATLLAGCFTGERGHFAEAAPTTVAGATDPAIAAVLAKLDVVDQNAFTAQYNILMRFGAITSLATVAQSTPATTSVTIGPVRFLSDASRQQTCDVATATCVDGFDDARISNLVPTHDFYRTSVSARLRQDAATLSAPANASTRTIAGQVATCVTVPFEQGIKEYCALDNGLLAYQDTPDLQIDLTSLASEANPSLFTPGP